MVRVTGLERLAVLGAGLGAGILTTTVGVASLLSFPVLVALGIPPVVANASNTVGLIPAGISGSFGYREELRAHPRVTIAVILTCAGGAVLGAVLLLAMPAGVFEAVVPWLILFTCLLVGAQPTISGWVRTRRTGPDAHLPRTLMSPVTTVFAALTGVYGGYFGAGSGVMMVAVLGLGLDLELRVVNALKTMAVFAANVVAGAIFLVVADLDWAAVALLAIGSVFGGYLGARVGRRLPPTLFRVLVVLAGIVAAVTMLT
ncbi:MAG: putative rane transporter protein [Nocardioides sp.]|nr:putative rane transporter protein [Nocardioides sp.]